MYNVEQLTAASSESLKTIVRDGMITLGLLGYLFYTNWRLTICIMVFLPVIGILVRKASKECANSRCKFRTLWVMLTM